MPRRRKLGIALGIAAAVLAIGAACAGFWLSGAFLPAWTAWDEFSLTVDLDKDGAPETLELAGRRLAVRNDTGQTAFESDPNWHVFDAMCADIDRDGVLEVVALVWKRGSYGESRPFWVESDDIGFSQHIFVFRYNGETLEPVWMSSAIDFEVAEGFIDNDARLHALAPDGSTVLLEWDTWGFVFIEEDADAGSSGSSADANAPAIKDDSITLAAAGDVIAHTPIFDDAWDDATDAFDFHPLFAHVADALSAYDAAAVVQETPFTYDPDNVSDFPRFAAPASLGDALADVGFDIVLAATNHAYDLDRPGVETTLSFWEDYPAVTLLGVHASPAAADTIAYRDIDGMRVALFDVTYGLNTGELPAEGAYAIDTLSDLERIEGQLRTANEEEGTDLAICFVHIGEEYAMQPTAEQREVAQRLIDAGADAVICSHAHVVQPCETVRTPNGNEGVVCWGLGNFVAAQGTPETAIGAIAELELERKDDGSARIASCLLVPTICHVDRTDGSTAVYFLDDYTDELAQRHSASTPDNPLTLRGLWRLWHAEIGR